MDRKVAIIGAGISGLLACKYTMEKGFNPIVFEARSGIGGVWSQTLESTKLQTPKDFYQFSDFPWPPSVKNCFPDHNQVMNYLQSYAIHFKILPARIQFNSKVVAIDYFTPFGDDDDDDVIDTDLWGGTGEAFSSTGKWKVTVQEDTVSALQVYEVDFVILCIGKFSDLPHIPDFPKNHGPQVFNGEVLHSMDYAAMDDDCAAKFVKDKRVTIIGFQKSAVDIASEVATINGVEHPCMLLFKKVYWMVPDSLHKLTFRNLNRFSELMIHKPREGFFLWLLAFLLSPLLWIFGKTVENYLKWKYTLKKYKMVPSHGFLKQISACMLSLLPANFYGKVKEGSIILKKSQGFQFYENGLIIQGEEEDPIVTDIVIFATGYNSDEKLKNIFTSTYFQECIVGSSVPPLYRDCIHPRIPQVAILGYADSPATLYTTEMRTKWVVNFLLGKFKLPNIKEMENDVMEWEKCIKRYYAGGGGEGYKRSCTTVLLQIHCNDLLCRDMGFNPKRKTWFLPELFSPYGPTDYSSLL